MQPAPVVSEPLTPREAAELLVFMTRAMGFSVDIQRGPTSVRVQARTAALVVTVTNDGADDRCLHAAVAEMAEQVACALDD